MIIDAFCDRWRFLSNFYPCRIRYEDVDYKSVEHAFQAAKTTDAQWREATRQARTAMDAKKIGRSAPLRPGWEAHLRYTVMAKLLEYKFTASSDLAGKLLSTGNAILIESNRWHDNLWGDCRCGGRACVKTGANLLGWMLMRQRERIEASSHLAEVYYG